ncbi:MAG: HAMP domain-containing histidine kinase [Ruminococcus sp.]|nr:HAMP domain-containing histidine kinase [Ruminococcus sp.]MDE6784771.1 HAMP domain-containing histidine kinase [Ruminococcus sp.]
MVLKHKITRITAFIVSCILVVTGAFSVLKIANKANSFYDNRIISTYEISEDINEIYRKLWIIGVMYLRNCDKNGNFTGTKELEENTIFELKRYGCMDTNGNLALTGNTPDGYVYSVSYDDAEFTNTDKAIENDEYTFRRYEDYIDMPSICNWSYSIYNFNWYETNYGMTYYEIPDRSTAVYDFDTDGMSSIKDRKGAVIYYNTDGTTPIPEEALGNESINFNDVIENSAYYDRAGNRVVYDEYGNRIIHEEDEDIVQDYEFVSSVPEGSIYVYRDGEFQRVKSNNFSQKAGLEQSLTISIRPDSEKIAEYQNYIAAESAFDQDIFHSLVDCIPVFAIAILLMIYFFAAGGYSIKEKKFVTGRFDKLFVELPIIIAGVAVCFGIIYVAEYYDITKFFKNYYDESIVYIIYSAVFGIVFAVFGICMNSIIIRMKCRTLFKTSLIARCTKFVCVRLKKLYVIICERFRKLCKNISDSRISRDMMKNNKIVRNFVLRIILALILEFFVLLVGLGCEEFVVFVIGSIIVIGLYVYLSLNDINAMDRLCSHISDMNSGNYISRKEEEKSLIYVPTEKLNNISAGIQAAVDRQIKSERMKIDLVTNVSHDLKTPLTSIISYIDLLSSEELEASARDYVTVIQQKSEQLKIMVADLFDLAKATSRTDVNLEQIDAVILTEQVLADSEDRIKLSGKELRKDIQIKTALITADGKRMYRVLQNLIDNALKYSLDGTRIYLTVTGEKGDCVISLKNIASYEMTFSPDEITERFTRGDESRTTDGNGLGLSIAKSFTEASGGQFRVSVDGDLFKAEIRFKVLIQNNISNNI